MRRVLMVSPHFPPDSSAASHRVRLLAPYLAENGWEPTVVTVDSAAFESRLDPRLEQLVPASIQIVRAPAWSARTTRRLGIGDLGLRAYTGLRATCRALMSARRFDALFITVYPVYPALLGGSLKSEFGVPFVLDYQDPWVGAWGQTVGGGNNGKPDWRSRTSRQLGVWLEPRAVHAADALVAVSRGTLDGILERLPEARRTPQLVLPLGFEPADFDRARSIAATPPFDPTDGLVHLCYVGTVLPKGIDTLRLLLRALVRAKAEDSTAARLRLHFYGTSNQTAPDRDRVLPLAREFGVADVVTEHAGRLDYLDALTVLLHASAIVLLGSSEPHYTASKLYPALLARRPLLALFHESSSVVALLKRAAVEPTVRVVTCGPASNADDARCAEVACHLRRLAASPEYRPVDVRFADLEDVSARTLAGDLARLLDRVAA